MKKKNKILITGVAGFIGSALANKLKYKYEVYGIDDLSYGKIENIPKGIKFYKKDLSNIKSLSKFIAVDYIMHLAGQSSADRSFDDPILDLKKNAVTTLNLINYAIKKKVKKIIYASSMSVYGNSNNIFVQEGDYTNPASCYGASKLLSENYLFIFRKKIKFIIFRMFNVYGPGQNMKDLNQGMVSIYLSQFLKKKKITVRGSLERLRDFIYIDDVLEIWEKSLNSSIYNQVFNLGTGIGTSVKNLLLLISKKKKLQLITSTRGDQYKIISNNNKTKKIFKKKKFIRLKDGIQRFLQYETNK
jgi:UDP-glucose 4-epimerase